MWYRYRINKDYEEINSKILLETSEANINYLINAVPEGIIVIDKNEKIIMKNEAYNNLLQEENISYVKLLEKYTPRDSTFNESLLECINEFKYNTKNSIKFGFFVVKSVYIECTGTKIK